MSFNFGRLASMKCSLTALFSKPYASVNCRMACPYFRVLRGWRECCSFSCLLWLRWAARLQECHPSLGHFKGKGHLLAPVLALLVKKTAAIGEPIPSANQLLSFQSV